MIASVLNFCYTYEWQVLAIVRLDWRMKFDFLRPLFYALFPTGFVKSVDD